MDLKTALKIITYHQKWRMGDVDDAIYTPKQISEGLKVLIKLAQKQLKAEARLALEKKQMNEVDRKFAEGNEDAIFP
jgi:hypothetical protein